MADTSNTFHDDLREMREMLTENLALTNRMCAVLFPPNEPSAITTINKRINRLESWRSYLTGAYAVIAGLFSIHVLSKH